MLTNQMWSTFTAAAVEYPQGLQTGHMKGKHQCMPVSVEDNVYKICDSY